jgi:hypothetical protein
MSTPKLEIGDQITLFSNDGVRLDIRVTNVRRDDEYDIHLIDSRNIENWCEADEWDDYD